MKLKNLAEKYNYKCYYCHQTFPLECLSRDHYYPINNRRCNHKSSQGSILVLACKACNCAKDNKPPELFIKKKKEMSDEELDDYFLELSKKN